MMEPSEPLAIRTGNASFLAPLTTIILGVFLVGLTVLLLVTRDARVFLFDATLVVVFWVMMYFGMRRLTVPRELQFRGAELKIVGGRLASGAWLAARETKVVSYGKWGGVLLIAGERNHVWFVNRYQVAKLLEQGARSPRKRAVRD